MWYVNQTRMGRDKMKRIFPCLNGVMTPSRVYSRVSGTGFVMGRPVQQGFGYERVLARECASFPSSWKGFMIGRIKGYPSETTETVMPLQFSGTPAM